MTKVSKPGHGRARVPNEASWAPKCWPGISTELFQVKLIILMSIPCNLRDDVVDVAGSSGRLGMHAHDAGLWAQAVTFLGRQKSIPTYLCSVLRIAI